MASIATTSRPNAVGRWFLVHTLPRSEKRARLRLEAQGFKTHLPEIDKTVRHARQLRNVRVPLFARYLFVVIDLDRDRWLSIRGTPGVSSLFTCDDRPVPVPEGVVEAIIERTDRGQFVHPGLHPGQRVRIISGALTDQIGTLDRLDESGRVRVLLEMMGTLVTVTTNYRGLQPAA